MTPAQPLVARFDPTSKDPTLHQYLFAGRPLISDRTIEILGTPAPVPLELASAFHATEGIAQGPRLPPSNASEIFLGEGFIAGRQRPLTCHFLGEVGWVQIAQIGSFRITPRGFTLVEQETSKRGELELAILGPTLILVLALGGIFCLHSSGVAVSDRALEQEAGILFLGSSGAGKSTLAHYLGSKGWRQVADDLIPIAAGDREVAGLPGFPQPKSPDLTLRSRLPIHSFLLLDEGEEPRLEAVPPAEAALALVRHTAAARLFSPSLMARHLDAVTQWTGLAPVHRLRYPRRWDALDAVAKLIRADSSRGHPSS